MSTDDLVAAALAGRWNNVFAALQGPDGPALARALSVPQLDVAAKAARDFDGNVFQQLLDALQRGLGAPED